MSSFDSPRVAALAVDTAVHTLVDWKDGRGTVDAQTLHHVLSFLADLCLPSNDPLVEDLETYVSLSRDAEAEFGFYTLALAKLGPLSSNRVSAARGRLKMSRAELALRILNTPFSRDLLERLMICEALILHRDQLSPEELSDLISHLRTLTQEIAEHDGDREQSYPAMLLALVGDHTSTEKHYISSVFTRLRDQIAGTQGALWYGESLANNCFVILNAIRSSAVIGPEMGLDIWERSSTRLRDLAKNRAAFFSLNLSKTTIWPILALPELLPYVRVLLAAHDLDDGFRLELVGRTASAYERILENAYSTALEESERQRFLAEAVRKVIASSVLLESTFERLGGGLSGSEVYVAAVNIKQPFSVSGQTLVFKVAEGASHGREIRILERLREIGIQDSFAAILSEPTTVKIGDEYPNILLYEHLAGFVTLRQVLQDQIPEAHKLALLSSVCQRLSAKIYSVSWQSEETTRVWASVLNKVVETSSRLSLSKHPVFSAKIAILHERTMQFLKNLPALPSFEFGRSIMHGDLNCRNIMVKIAGHDVLDMKLIDYETLDLHGDILVDVGELIEDAILSCSFVRKLDSVENIIRHELLGRAIWLRTEPAAGERLTLARLRSVLLVIKHLLLAGTPETDRLIYRAINRWASLLASNSLSFDPQVGKQALS
jgi:hypothetical protein